MEVLGRIKLGRLAMIGAAVAAVFIMGHFAQTPAMADHATQMSISVSGCSGDECNLDNGEAFTVSVNVDTAPDNGYVLVQSFIDYGPNLTYNMTDAAGDEVVWPDGSSDVVVRDSFVPGTILHGGLTGVIPPLPLSTYTGTVFELSFECSDDFSTNNVQLLPSGDDLAGTSGAVFTTVVVTDGVDVSTQVIPDTNSITVNCGAEPTPTPEEPDVLPPLGSGALSAGDTGSSAMMWLVIGALVVAGAGLGTFGWHAARSRQE